MFRTARVMLFCGFALALWPATASAQFMRGSYMPGPFMGGSYMGGIPGASFIPGNPLYPLTPYAYQPSFAIPRNSVYGPTTAYVPNGLPNPLATANPFYSWYATPSARAGYGSSMPWMGYGGAASSGYMSGGTRPNYGLQYAQQQYARTQQGANGYGRDAKDVIAGQWGYEKGAEPVVVVAKDGTPAGEELAKALTGGDEGAVLSGDSLNVILTAVMAAEAKGAKGPSEFLSPQVLNAVRFSGSPAADALNLLRQAGKLPFPAVFADPVLADVRVELERDFVDAAAPLREGKPADAMKLTRLTFTLQKVQEAAAPIIRNLPFDESSAARQFLHQLERALVAMRVPTAVALVNPAWATEGASVADLVKHMTKQKLLFGPAPAGGEEDYFTLHKGLATYYFVLTQPKK